MTRLLTFGDAIQEAITQEMTRDERIFYMACARDESLEQRFGKHRSRQTPIAESAMTGMAVGAAGSGYRPIVRWGNVTFSFVAFDQIINQAARIRYMFGGQRDFPIVFLAMYWTGTRTAAQHSQTGFALYAHASGLKLLAPSTPADAKGLLTSAIRDDNPVVFVNAERLLSATGEVPEGEHIVPIGKACTLRSGDDVTIVGLGYMAQVALRAAEALAEDGISAEVVDPRSLVPLDVAAIRASVRRTGRLVIADESFPTCSMAAEIATCVTEDEQTFHALQAPVRRVCTAPVPVPFSPPLEDVVLPDVEDIRDAVRGILHARVRA
jgi:acetoin:2,6-dichlorophenolindophenol oxidoreductase subunit beta